MNKKMVKNVAKVALLAGVFGLAGCAFVPDTVHDHYKAPASMAKVPGAENVTVTVIVHDRKKRHDLISQTQDGFGIDMSGVYLHIDKVFKSSIDSALEKRGFSIGVNGANVQVVVKQFYLHEERGWNSITHTGNLDMQVLIPSVGYEKTVRIEHFRHKIEGPFTLSVGRTSSATALLSAGVNKLVENPQFIAALLKAGHAGAVVPRLPAS